jgi:hypothetical protein
MLATFIVGRLKVNDFSSGGYILRIVGDQHHGQPLPFCRLPDEITKLRAKGPIEAGERLI